MRLGRPKQIRTRREEEVTRPPQRNQVDVQGQRRITDYFRN